MRAKQVQSEFRRHAKYKEFNVDAYPGPILSREVLAAYLSVSTDEAGEIVEKANIASYDGPFGDVKPFVWRDAVDAALAITVQVSDSEPPNESERFKRFAAMLILGR